MPLPCGITHDSVQLVGAAYSCSCTEPQRVTNGPLADCDAYTVSGCALSPTCCTVKYTVSPGLMAPPYTVPGVAPSACMVLGRMSGGG